MGCIRRHPNIDNNYAEIDAVFIIMVEDPSSKSIEAYFDIFNLKEKKIFLNYTP